jgi:hypothetical protein
VPLSDLGNILLSNFIDRIRALNTWAVAQKSLDTTVVTVSGHPVYKQRFAGVFPTFFHADYGQGVVCGAIALTTDAAEMRHIPQSQLGNTSGGDFEARFAPLRTMPQKMALSATVIRLLLLGGSRHR